jgi:cold shock CspA family protein
MSDTRNHRMSREQKLAYRELEDVPFERAIVDIVNPSPRVAFVQQQPQTQAAMHGSIVSAKSDFFFIRRDDGQPDVFLGTCQLEIDGLRPPKIGDRVRFDVKASDRGHRPFNVQVIQ